VSLAIPRGAEGLITIDTALSHSLTVPVVAVAGHKRIQGVTNVVLDHKRAAELSLGHLYQLGHRHIAFMRGQPFSADSDERWRCLVGVARELGVEIRPELTIQLERDLTTPELRYPVVQQLLQQHGRRFSAIVAFNDVSAIGAIRALRDANLRVPEDVSVIGFDDISVAAYHTPRLTTIRPAVARHGRNRGVRPAAENTGSQRSPEVNRRDAGVDRPRDDSSTERRACCSRVIPRERLSNVKRRRSDVVLLRRAQFERTRQNVNPPEYGR